MEPKEEVSAAPQWSSSVYDWSLSSLDHPWRHGDAVQHERQTSSLSLSTCTGQELGDRDMKVRLSH